jgi:PAS domain S-box-containing protein
VSQSTNLPLHPHKHSHVVQFYSDNALVVREAGKVLGEALSAGQSAVVIATLDHRNKIAEKLKREVQDFENAVAGGRYISLDAAELLSGFMVGGMPDPQRFTNIVGRLVARAASAARSAESKVVAFGEMVAVLCAEGNSEAALKLETLWNQLLERNPFFLYCAYPTQAFHNSSGAELFLSVCSEHGGVVGDSSIPKLYKAGANTGESTPGTENNRRWKEIEDRFRLFVESVQDYALFLLDPKGNVTSWNRGAKRIKGYDASEIIGKNFSNFYPEEDIRARKPEMELEVAAREGRFEDEGWRLRKDGSRFWASVIITAIRDDSGNLVGFGKVTRDITEKMQAQVALDRANQELKREVLERKLAEQRVIQSEKSLRSLSLHLLRTQDEERKRIGRDLHDSLGQVLTAMKLNLAGAKGETDEDQVAIERCIGLADDCIREVRTISYLLYPPMLEELGLKSAIPWYLDGFTQRSGIKSNFECSADFQRLPRDMELALFRLLQEALTNVHRHSESLVAQVRLHRDGNNAVLEIQDAGKGLPEEIGKSGSTPATGVGLRGMDERMRQLGGRLQISCSGKGTTLTAIVPIAVPAVEPMVAVPVSA